jgi:hypothetical protein
MFTQATPVERDCTRPHEKCNELLLQLLSMFRVAPQPAQQRGRGAQAWSKVLCAHGGEEDTKNDRPEQNHVFSSLWCLQSQIHCLALRPDHVFNGEVLVRQTCLMVKTLYVGGESGEAQRRSVTSTQRVNTRCNNSRKLEQYQRIYSDQAWHMHLENAMIITSTACPRENLPLHGFPSNKHKWYTYS